VPDRAIAARSAPSIDGPSVEFPLVFVIFARARSAWSICDAIAVIWDHRRRSQSGVGAPSSARQYRVSENGSAVVALRRARPSPAGAMRGPIAPPAGARTETWSVLSTRKPSSYGAFLGLPAMGGLPWVESRPPFGASSAGGQPPRLSAMASGRPSQKLRDNADSRMSRRGAALLRSHAPPPPSVPLGPMRRRIGPSSFAGGVERPWEACLCSTLSARAPVRPPLPSRALQDLGYAPCRVERFLVRDELEARGDLVARSVATSPKDKSPPGPESGRRLSPRYRSSALDQPPRKNWLGGR